MSMTGPEIAALDYDQRARGCGAKFGIISLTGLPWSTWEAYASVPSQTIRDILWPWCEPDQMPDGPYTVLCGMAFADFLLACAVQASIEQQPQESDFAYMARLLAA